MTNTEIQLIVMALLLTATTALSIGSLIYCLFFSSSFIGFYFGGIACLSFAVLSVIIFEYLK